MKNECEFITFRKKCFFLLFMVFTVSLTSTIAETASYGMCIYVNYLTSQNEIIYGKAVKLILKLMANLVKLKAALAAKFV